MNLKSLQCPNCGGAYNPAKRNCEYCGSYIIFTDLKEENYSANDFLDDNRPQNYKGIYIYGILLDHDEYPIRMGVANYKKSAFNAVGGHLLLTNKRLAFISHGLNFGGKMELNIQLNQLTRADAGANFGISAQFHAYDIFSNKHTFVIYGRNEWVNKTNGAINGDCEPINPEKKDTAYIDELVQLKRLLDQGIITQEDFDIKKRLILKI